MKDKSQVGIYSICSLVDNKIYIGSSVNLQHRKTEHFNNLKRGIHPNRHLQNSYKINGIDNFIFRIVELCPKSKLLKRELFWINREESYNRDKGFNMLRNPTNKNGVLAPRYGQKHKRSSIKKMSDVATKRWESKNKRKEHSKILKKSFEDPKKREEISKRAKRWWNDHPEQRTKQSQKMSSVNIKNWKDPVYQKKMSIISSKK